MQANTMIAITGMGITSAIGNNVYENYKSLSSSKHGIKNIQILETLHKDKLLAAEINFKNEELYSILELNQKEAYTRTSLLAIIAAKEAFDSSEINLNDGFSTGLISGITVGGMDASEKYYNEYLESDKHLNFIKTHNCNYHTKQISDYLGIKGFTSTISTACSSGANAIMLGARMIKSGILDRVIVGGADALSKFTINGFNSLMIYSDEHCKPFDKDRKGLNLGEAAAYLILESEECIKARNRGNKILAYISGYGNANDAFHQTASSDNGEGAFIAMNKALKAAELKPKDIDYINAHGTATPNNDLTEGTAISRIFGKEKIPPFSSTKSFTGHTLAASGAVEAVFSVLALKNQVIYPNLNFNKPISELEIIPNTEFKNLKINNILSNSLGFGGNCSSLIFSKS